MITPAMDSRKSVVALFSVVILIVIAVILYLQVLPTQPNMYNQVAIPYDLFMSSNVCTNCSFPSSSTHSIQTLTAASTDKDGKPLPIVFIVTPTYKRLTQKVDLTKMCQTLMIVKQVKWIVIEDSANVTDLVTHLLADCTVDSVHLFHKTVANGKGHRGVGQRNTGLQWILDNVAFNTTDGVIYMGDDDNSYDIRLFEEMRYTKKVSIWPVAFAGGLLYEGPVCKDGKVVKWHVSWAPNRSFPCDMAAFAVGLKHYTQYKPKFNPKSKPGYLETDFLKALKIKQQDLEAKADDCTKIYVWHTKTRDPNVNYNSDSDLETR